MQEYDRLPSALRRWLANAQRPWSPHSCRAIWQATLARGGDTQEALARLDRIEAAMLARDSG
jgi:hypothetical protein